MDNAATEATILGISDLFDPTSGMARVCALENQNLLARTDLREKDVLEVGCGCLPACFGIPDERMPRRYIATDTSQALVDAARRTDPRPEYRVVSATEPSFPEASFDVLILRGVLHHLPRPAETLATLRAYLRPGGQLLLYEPNLSCIPGNIIKWFAWKLFRVTMEDSPYGQLPRETILAAIHTSGFTLKDEWYTSLFAFWLSGDYGRRPLLPNWHSLYRAIVATDVFFSRVLHGCPPLARAFHLRTIFLIENS